MSGRTAAPDQLRPALPVAVADGVILQVFDRPDTRRLREEIFDELVYEVGDLGPAPLILDCGANLGLATAWFTLRYPGCRIRAFEPEPDALALLRHNAAEQGWSHVEVVGAALADSDGTATLYRDANRPAHPRASLLSDRISGRQVEVPTVRLSANLPDDCDVDLLKMDVEGFEWSVLREVAGRGGLTRIRRLAVEFHHNLAGAGRLSDVLRLLEDSGFRYTLRARRHGVNCSAFQNVMIYADRDGARVGRNEARREPS
jgi:FkbM family methyltransferase